MFLYFYKKGNYSKFINHSCTPNATLQIWNSETAVKNPFKKGKTLGFHFTFHDFATASEIKSNGLSNVLTEKDWMKTARMSPGLALSYTKGISDNLDIMTRFGGSILRYPVPGSAKPVTDKLLMEADVNLNIKLLTDQYTVVPYFSIGAGASTWGGYGSAYIPMGVGLQVHLAENTHLLFQSQYRAPVTTNNGARHLFWGMGITSDIGKK
jgi:hypothetical protein